MAYFSKVTQGLASPQIQTFRNGSFYKPHALPVIQPTDQNNEQSCTK